MSGDHFQADHFHLRGVGGWQTILTPGCTPARSPSLRQSGLDPARPREPLDHRSGRHLRVFRFRFRVETASYNGAGGGRGRDKALCRL